MMPARRAYGILRLLLRSSEGPRVQSESCIRFQALIMEHQKGPQQPQQLPIAIDVSFRTLALAMRH